MFRFEDWKSEKSTENYGVHPGRIRLAINSFSEKFQRGVESSSERMKGIKKSLKSYSFNSARPNGLGSRFKILDPQGAFLQKWNKIFVLSCVIAVSLDPLFFYVPVINDAMKCLDLDYKMEITAIILRSFTDIFYVTHIFFSIPYWFYCPLFSGIWKRCFGRRCLGNSTEVSVIILPNRHSRGPSTSTGKGKVFLQAIISVRGIEKVDFLGFLTLYIILS